MTDEKKPKKSLAERIVDSEFYTNWTEAAQGRRYKEIMSKPSPDIPEDQKTTLPEVFLEAMIPFSGLYAARQEMKEDKPPRDYARRRYTFAALIETAKTIAYSAVLYAIITGAPLSFTPKEKPEEPPSRPPITQPYDRNQS